MQLHYKGAIEQIEQVQSEVINEDLTSSLGTARDSGQTTSMHITTQ